MSVSALRRVTDLFVEGKVVPLGIDEDGRDVTVWVNKPNSFEREEAQRDGRAAQAARQLALRDPENPEWVVLRDDVRNFTDEGLIIAIANMSYNEDNFRAVQDIQADPEWADRLEILRRQPTLLDDAAVPEEDSRRKQVADISREYLERIDELTQKRQDERRKDLRDMSRKDREEAYLEKAIEALSIEAYQEARRMTEVFYALRVCTAVRDEKTGTWDTSRSDHSVRLLDDRSQVRTLPDALVRKVVETLDELLVPQHEAGNSDAPASSSASSEQPSEEVASKPSTRKGTSRGSRTT